MSNYFKDQGKRGENAELQEELASTDKTKKRDAVKKVIRDMTLGKDVAGLFTAVVNCMMTPNLEVRKLVYLYLINYAKTQPDLAIMAVNGFVKDCGDPNPIIRALAVRTMGCIRVQQISEYLCEPLRRALKDSDPYVRKTAAICVAKLYEISPDLVTDQGFIETLNDMLGDGNPMVVSNAVAALAEISVRGTPKALVLKNATVTKLLNVLNECSEWGQVFILDVLSSYIPSDKTEAVNILERVKPRLQHANSAVVLSTTKVIVKLLDIVTDSEVVRTYVKSLGPPLVTLMSNEAEIQYVALRNIILICQKRPSVLSNEVKVFFCKYNDPIYVKMEKLDVLVMLANENNIEQVLMEFMEYATEIDCEFVCKAVRCIGRCAIKLQGAAERCVNVLVTLIQTKVNYVVQEAIIVIRDIFRKYPNKYESVIGTLCENLDTLDNSEAKASMVWIIGEYAERIDNAGELLDGFLESFSEETTPVQLQLLTATVKLFLKRPQIAQEMVKRVLALVTHESDNPDVRDRGYMYWRLLSTNPEAAKAIVLADKPTIEDDTNLIEPALLEDLISNLSNLASVYHKRPTAFIDRKKANDSMDDYEEAEEPDNAQATASEARTADHPQSSREQEAAKAPVVDMLLLDDPVAPATQAVRETKLDDLLSLDAPAPSQSARAQGGDLLDMLGGPPTATSSSAQLPMLLAADKGNGMEMYGAIKHVNGQLGYELEFKNKSATVLNGINFQMNKNVLGLTLKAPLTAPDVPPAGSHRVFLPLASDPSKIEVKPHAGSAGGNVVQLAVKSNLGVLYLTDSIELAALASPGFSLAPNVYMSTWQSLPHENQTVKDLSGFPMSNPNAIEQALQEAHLFLVNKQAGAGPTSLYLAGKTVANQGFLLEIQILPTACRVTIKSNVAGLAGILAEAVESYLRKALGGASSHAATMPAMGSAGMSMQQAPPAAATKPVDLLAGLF
mmetsp:Transcript_27871/g.63052  ORF Transcript_27871/g.63052 Transcript_27871/m.63052 type:complete len:959 (-) Transcript_27871:1-2877(-)